MSRIHNKLRILNDLLLFSQSLCPCLTVLLSQEPVTAADVDAFLAVATHLLFVQLDVDDSGELEVKEIETVASVGGVVGVASVASEWLLCNTETRERERGLRISKAETL